MEGPRGMPDEPGGRDGDLQGEKLQLLVFPNPEQGGYTLITGLLPLVVLKPKSGSV